MSDDATPRLSLPYLAAGQAQKHLTVNEALARLDGLVQAAVESRTTTAQPGAPADGDAWILPEGRTGEEWALHPVGALLRFESGDWIRLPTAPGAVVHVADEGGLVVREPAGWSELSAALKRLQNLERLGVGTTADATNPLAAKLNKALFTARPASEGGDGDLRYTLNKETAGDVLSLLLQSGFSGRAEIGLVGDDDLRVKVSADGAAWSEALRVERAGGRVWAGGAVLGRDAAVNLLPDSGRFTGNGSNGVFSGAPYVAPSYLQASGGSVLSAHARFVHDNADYGGAGAALHPDVRALVDEIHPVSARRYGVEWWVMKAVRGSTPVEPVTIGADTFDLLFTNSFVPLPRELTCGYHLRVLAGKAAVSHGGAGSFVDGGFQPPGAAPTVVGPGDGWRYVDRLARANPYGYEYNLFGLRATAGAEVLVAIPRVVFGHVVFDPAAGVLPNDAVFA